MTASPGAMDMHSPGSVLATVPEEEQVNTEFQSLVSAKGLILPPEEELNWSGKGQHVEFLFDHEIPLEFIAAVAASPKAMVEKVRCQRIILARKTMRCSRGWTLKDALLEVEHLNRLRHTHIIQMVGSYLSGRKFSILLYPAADCDLGTFLENTQDLLLPRALGLDTQYYSRKRSLQKSLRCIAQALKYIHAENTKHMDIKPANILVKLSSSPSEWWAPYKIYISDFGISKNFEDLGYSQTDGPTARSVKYCAPEVFSQDIRGRAADVFRWDACFAEILTVLGQKSLDAFADFRADNSPNSAMAFHASTYAATAWVKTLSQRVMFPPVDWPIERNLSMLPDLLESMLRQIPAERPTANSIALKLDNNFGTFNCCSAGSEAYTIEPPSS